MFVFYSALFVACLTGVCTFVVIGDKLRRIYIDWLGSADLLTRDEPARRQRPVYIESVLMQ
jgi:hypothetical protein